ncbi:MAG TPA: exodeoxyribonuclease III [Kaistia sp.]|nr:exodeoxyribonuclease III [Kaistia sp.]
MPLSIATWNINSVRLRIDLVSAFLEAERPDVLCLQEIKCIEGNFPAGAFRKLGYEHQVVHGQKGYHGVAVVAKVPITEHVRRGFCGKDDARHVAVKIGGGELPIVLHNFYVPAGGDEPNPDVNEKFAHKLAFLEEMKGWLRGAETLGPSILVGDLNVAPLEQDVWSHKQMLGVVSHTPAETQLLEAVIEAGGWIDAMRHFVPPEEKLYTWWSYRAADWEASNRGRRLDHMWVTPPLRGRLLGLEVKREARGWNRPSDHVPVILRLAA